MEWIGRHCWLMGHLVGGWGNECWDGILHPIQLSAIPCNAIIASSLYFSTIFGYESKQFYSDFKTEIFFDDLSFEPF